MGRGEILEGTEIMEAGGVADHSITEVEARHTKDHLPFVLATRGTQAPIEVVDTMEVVAPCSTPEMDLHYRMSPMVRRKRTEGHLRTLR